MSTSLHVPPSKQHQPSKLGKALTLGISLLRIISDLIAFPAFHQDLLTFGRFSSPARWVPWRISPQPAPKATAIFSYSNSQKSDKFTKIKNHLQKSLTIFKHRHFCSKMFKNLQTFESLYGDWWQKYGPSGRPAVKAPPRRSSATPNLQRNQNPQEIPWKYYSVMPRESHRCPKFIEICIEKAVSQRISDFFYSVFLQDATIAEQSWSFRGRPFEKTMVCAF